MCGSVVGQRGALLEWEEVAEEAVTVQPSRFRERTQWECPGNKDKKLELELMASNKVLNAVAMLSEPSHPWNCPRPGWTGLGAAWSGERSPCPWNSEMR